MARVSQALVAALVALAIGCGSSSSEGEEQLRRARSWNATRALLLESWRAGALPDRYARDTLSTIERQLAEVGRR